MILFMDHNKHTYDGPLGRALADTSSLGLLSSSLGNKTVAGSKRSCISSASFGIQII
jgi:hypothetical protein